MCKPVYYQFIDWYVSTESAEQIPDKLKKTIDELSWGHYRDLDTDRDDGNFDAEFLCYDLNGHRLTITGTYSDLKTKKPIQLDYENLEEV